MVKAMQFNRRALFLLVAALFVLAPLPLRAQPLGVGAISVPGPMAELQHTLAAVALHASANVGIDVEDLATGYESGVNVNQSMPAASTIKIPVMVEVFRQMEAGNFDLHHELHLQASDKDDGWGDLYYAPVGTPVGVDRLLWLMITNSDNTATNMLIRLVGRNEINATMRRLGLHHTYVGDYIRSENRSIRSLRSSPHDMVLLLDAMAHRTLIDAWASAEMIAILTGQRHNGLLPQPLPAGTTIAHKTGTLHDTLNDVGIVFLAGEPYAIAVMTTNLPDLDLGRNLIRHVSLVAYDSFKRFQRWRVAGGLPGFNAQGAVAAGQPISPDV